jgi:hypothetical protein
MNGLTSGVNKDKSHAYQFSATVLKNPEIVSPNEVIYPITIFGSNVKRSHKKVSILL